MNHESFRRMIRTQIFPITRCISLGPFAAPARQDDLRKAGITDVLNVGETPSLLVAGPDSFHEVVWKPVVDLERIPDAVALDCLDALHRLAAQPASRVYVHCVAGWNRAPTVVWLYLIACGLEPEAAKRLIASRSLDAIPGHPQLIDADLVRLVRRLGQTRYLPLSRAEILKPA